jgi:hypothetical protein
MPTVFVADFPGIDQSTFSASLVRLLDRPATLTVKGEVSGDYRVQKVELVRAQHQPTATTLVLDVMATLGPVENPHPDFIRLIPVEYVEDPARHNYHHVKIVSGAEQFTIKVIDIV